MDKAPLVGIVMGSTSDLETMRAASIALDELHIPHEMRVVSGIARPTCSSITRRPPPRADCASSSRAPAARHICRA
jgi:hypothetical protein